MKYRILNIITVVIGLSLIALFSPTKGKGAISDIDIIDLPDIDLNKQNLVITPGSSVQSGILSSWSCLPHYSSPNLFLQLDPPSDLWGVRSADFNNDGWPDAILWRGSFQSGINFKLDVLLNNQNGSLKLGTSEVFSGTVPSVVEGRELVLDDFNGDGRTDLFFADQGRDSPPHPGYQNTLVLSMPGGMMVDATSNLPQQNDMTHSATTADIDGDNDIDIYVGNIWGQNMYPPQIWLNSNNSGVFSAAPGRLPFPLEDLDYGAYTTSEFVDVNNDGISDLILGDAGDDLSGGRDSVVLLNDGTGYFSFLNNAIPPKPFAETDIALDIDADDINGDGYQDLFMVFTKGSYVGRYIQILINNKDGTFSDETSTRLPQSNNNNPWISFVNLLDLDKDGHHDIVAAPVGGSEPLYYLNNGNGFFRPLPNVFNIGIDNLFTFLDIDQDGFLDVLWSYPRCSDGTCPEVHFIVRTLGCPAFLPLVGRTFSAITD